MRTYFYFQNSFFDFSLSFFFNYNKCGKIWLWNLLGPLIDRYLQKGNHITKKGSISCLISKQRMSESSDIAASTKGELVNPEGTQEGN